MKQSIKAEIMLEIVDIIVNTPISDKARIWEEFEKRIDAILEMKSETKRAFAGKNSLILETNSEILAQVYHEIGQEMLILLYLQMERLVQEANDLLNPNKNLCVNDVTVTLDCGFQWIPYNYQSTDGNTYYWIEDQLSGECGISRKHEGVWFNITG